MHFTDVLLPISYAGISSLVIGSPDKKVYTHRHPLVVLSAMGETQTWQKAEAVFRKHGGLLRASEAIALGVDSRVQYGLRGSGRLRQISRGAYRLSDLPELGNPDLATVATRIPQGVVCLISALAFHGITTQIPHQVDVDVPRGTKQPRLDFPPIRLLCPSPLRYKPTSRLSSHTFHWET